ncbi:MAG: TIGR02206 family membrane protein [Saprospiraceae bacterium]|nr:MAG: Integral membrane protein [Bacteroidetes bacterium OLB9]MCO6463186.1 TIGR02206 family membrane protein [Saprospiraceae bacterium]MCZ2337091.1 TIGR02206 family membrane protein [Chitinophagales bacterium]
MLDAFLKDNGQFSNYGVEHTIAFTLCIAAIWLMLYLAKYKWNDDQKYRYMVYISVFAASTQLFKVFYRVYNGTFNPTEDFPLHLCNLMVILLPFTMIFKWRKLWGITFFWIMIGCAQSIFTPTLTESMPHYEAVRYWVIHSAIILGALYGIYAFGWTITWKDTIRSILGMNILAAILFPINLVLHSNYMYLNAKPPGTTFYDLLGPWPGYIIWLEVLVNGLFTLVLIPFYWNDIKRYLARVVA